MRAVVLGAGAVGGGVAALLHRVDARTCVVARGATLEAVRAQGLRFWQREEQWTARPEAYAGLDRVEWTDDSVLLVAVKPSSLAASACSRIRSSPSMRMNHWGVVRKISGAFERQEWG